MAKEHKATDLDSLRDMRWKTLSSKYIYDDRWFRARECSDECQYTHNCRHRPVHRHFSEVLQHVKKLTGLHGRWELIQNNPAVILDVGHNVDGVKQLSRQLELTDYDHLHIITGMVKDKDVDAVLALLPQDATYYFTQAQIPRTLDAVTLQQKAAGHLLIGNTYPNVNEALQHALAHAHKNDLVLVCGSVFLVGEVKR